MRRKASVATSITWSNKYLWQEKIGQCSILTRKKGGKRRRRILCGYINCIVYQLYLWLFAPLIKMLGVHYVWEVVRDLLGNDTNKGATVRLDNDVKESIVQFLGDIVTNILEGKWLHLPDEHPLFRFHLLYFHDSPLNSKGRLTTWKHGGRYTSCVTTWHTATWYCEQVEREREEQEEALTNKAETAAGERERNQDRSRNRRVANILSKYCIYLVVSAPELLPGLATETTFAMDSFAKEVMAYRDYRNYGIHNPTFDWGMDIAKRLLSDDPRLPDVTRRSDPWETLAVVWVRLLLYAAPYGDGDAHMRHLAQGGEFITHLCALLYHLGIHEWKLPEVNDLHNISTIEEAQRILAEDEDDLDIIVVAFFATPDMLQKYRDGFVTMSRLIDGVKFYLTSSPGVAKSLYFPESILRSLKCMSMLVLNKVETKTAFFDSYIDEWNWPYDVALFVYETKLAWAEARAQEVAPCTFHNPIPIEKPGSEDDHAVVEIKEDVPTPPPS